MTENCVPPHMTISQIEARNENVLVSYMESLKGKIRQGEMQFVSVGMRPCVLYATSVMKGYLQGLLKEVFDTFVPFRAGAVEIGLVKVNPHEDVVRFEL